ncbi:MAG: hypothetical protein ABL994_22745, partial [Verrucomicrobiales bacterium]
FRSYMLKPEVAAQSANFTRYLTPNTAAMPLLDAELLADETLNPSAAMLDKCSVVPTLDDLEWLQQLQVATHAIHEALQAAESPGGSPATEPLIPVEGIK